MIEITPTLALDDSEIQVEFIRASGPGGQNVNKVSTAVQLRFDVPHSSLPEEVQQRLLKLSRSRINDEGVLIITAQGARSQTQNRQSAVTLLVELIQQAARRPKPHLKTRPTLASKVRRLEGKRRHSQIKQGRRTSFEE